MVLLNIVLLEGRKPEQKAAGLRQLTAAVVDALGVSPDDVCIVIEDVPRAHFSSGQRALPGS